MFNMVSIFLFVSLFSISDSFTLWYEPLFFFLCVCLMIQTSSMCYQAAVSCRESVANLSEEGFYFTISHTLTLPSPILSSLL